MSTPLPSAAAPPLPRVGLLWRAGIVAAVLAVETLLISYLIQKTPVDWVTGTARTVRDLQHWLFRFMIVYAVCLSMLAYLRGAERAGPSPARMSGIDTDDDIPVRGVWLGVHCALMLPFAVLSNGLYSGTLPLAFPVVAVAWHTCAAAAALALAGAAAPLRLWLRAVRQTGILPLYALLTAAAAVLAIQASQRLWEPTAQLTFRLVALVLRPLLPGLQSDFASLTVTTQRFAVTVSEQCSGLEGVGLMTVFCGTWLAYFRRDYHLPRALLIIPVAVLLVFALNALRIAALVLIGDAGYPGIAMVGFHSQAGWIAFNLVALGVAIYAKRSRWLHRAPDAPVAAAGPAAGTTSGNATAGYLMPLLAILAAGMIAHAVSAGFEYLYPLRFVAALAVLWACRRHYARLDWHGSWRAVAVGLLIAGIWVAFARYLVAPVAQPPAELSLLSTPARAVWLAARVMAATITVPIAEELAFRGYLLRRLVDADFQSVKLEKVGWLALAASAVAFGATHGRMWVPGIIAGAAYGALAIRRGTLGEAVLAHATSNACLAILVLVFGQWQLW